MTQPPPPEERQIDLEAEDEVGAVLRFFALCLNETLEKLEKYGGRASVDAALAVRFVDTQGEWPAGWMHLRTVGEPEGDAATLIAFYQEAARQVSGWDRDPSQRHNPPVNLKPKDEPNG